MCKEKKNHIFVSENVAFTDLQMVLETGSIGLDSVFCQSDDIINPRRLDVDFMAYLVI